MTSDNLSRYINPPAVPGIRLGCAQAGIKRAGRDDLLLVAMAPGGSCAAVFTRNLFCAAPVVLARKHLKHAPRLLVVNSGNANAGTGARGKSDAEQTCAWVAELAHTVETEVMPFSTGVIGEYLPMEKIWSALPAAWGALSEEAWERAAGAIMTTDTRPKLSYREIELDGHKIVIVGIAKGSGMIHPNMATMLSFIGTNAAVGSATLQRCLTEAVERSFNCITVDGDTSTNDACVLLASAVTQAPEIEQGSIHYHRFSSAIQAVCDDLAEAIVRDGEGATKLVRILVEQAESDAEALAIAKTVAHSPLVKTALFASDPNWGRILAAIGRSDCSGLDIQRVSIWLGDACIVQNGERADGYTESAGKLALAQDEVLIRVVMGRGQGRQQVLTCDLSYDYVRINAEYRT
ncbi:bifunctional glutamate N-acetyltransferase/amino-acid acetyltransferase ArgJ [Candidatus Methylospira mobilis]|uniref:Arginine biosynthesis bifunctional protein ArgJ n=1 Tax=Candidatus Methylospira mobilis TaxID=1808979 RepID=A0A5Q0BDW8_9GAMM|nr:bifunctional glutamate N-acetyltransferase/amino-acid acetyltransferase ArgJ [Candidatus Methylospira mobilis]QFY42045.1 bifunctional glutamate N-acetyltransferase/amino-acid acetyltransferase ArgJ [Candidatus Methylospira mobilis]WNV03052.1 bifunctional glutamate N-acetyltransferase/amino-acid acetyltransferase ArgJ [Candidatus Methylospira mobilis]